MAEGSSGKWEQVRKAIHTQRTDISKVTDGKISKIRRKINARPREKLNFLHQLKSFSKIFCNVALALVDSTTNCLHRAQGH